MRQGWQKPHPALFGHHFSDWKHSIKYHHIPGEHYSCASTILDNVSCCWFSMFISDWRMRTKGLYSIIPWLLFSEQLLGVGTSVKHWEMLHPKNTAGWGSWGHQVGVWMQTGQDSSQSQSIMHTFIFQQFRVTNLPTSMFLEVQKKFIWIQVAKLSWGYNRDLGAIMTGLPWLENVLKQCLGGFSRQTVTQELNHHVQLWSQDPPPPQKNMNLDRLVCAALN